MISGLHICCMFALLCLLTTGETFLVLYKDNSWCVVLGFHLACHWLLMRLLRVKRLEHNVCNWWKSRVCIRELAKIDLQLHNIYEYFHLCFCQTTTSQGRGRLFIRQALHKKLFTLCIDCLRKKSEILHVWVFDISFVLVAKLLINRDVNKMRSKPNTCENCCLSALVR